MNLFIYLFTLLIASQHAQASQPAMTTFVPFELNRHMMFQGQLRECLDSGDALITGISWGSEPDEVFKALARENGLPQVDFDKYQGPFKTFREYSRGIEAHRDSFIQSLKKKGFSALQFLAQNPDTSSFQTHQDTNYLIIQLTDSLNAVITNIAREKGWSTITAYINGVAFERNSPTCRRPPD